MGCTHSKPFPDSTASVGSRTANHPSTSLPALTPQRRTSNKKTSTTASTSGNTTTQPPATRKRADSWAIPNGSGLTSVEAQWKLLWETQSPYLVDPADVHSVLDALMNQTINTTLSPAQVTLVQRRIRTIVKKTLLEQQSAAAKMRVFSSSSESSSKTIATQNHLLTKQVVSRLLRPSPVSNNLCTILLYLTTGDRVAHVAQHTATLAHLQLDVCVNNNNNTIQQQRPMPKPSLVPDLSEPPTVAPGIPLEHVLWLLGLASSNTSRQQRLQLLFYACHDNLSDFLNQHSAGGVPTWLLEVGQGQVLSLASLTHYHYYGHAFLPIEVVGRTKRRFVASQSRQAVAISAGTVQQVLAFCFDNKTQPENTTTNTTNNPSSPMRRSNSQSNHGIAANVKSKPLRRNGSEGVESMTATDSGTTTTMSLMERLQMVYESGPEQEDLLVPPYFPDTIEPDTRWTLEDYYVWAQEHLDDTQLDVIMHGLLGAGVLPNHILERDLVKCAWEEWQHQYAVTKPNQSQQQTQGGGSTLDAITQSVKALLKSCENGHDTLLEQTTTTTATMDNNNNNTAKSSSSASVVWGGIGGVDGLGGTGYGVMYCIDKQWWDEWVAYVGWSWTGERPNKRQTLQRPGTLSTQRLLDQDPESSIPGTFGSYEVMKYGLEKNEDYVLVPPGVWDILYEMYGGGPPLPRMVKPPERKFHCSHHHSSDEEDGFEVSEMELDTVMSDVEVKSGNRVLRLPEHLSVTTHPWIIHCHLCDPLQPYRRGEAGPMSIRVMTTPDQPLWRLFVEVITRFPLQAYKAFGSDGRGKGRLWKKTEPAGSKDPVSRYGPWNLLCKGRHAIVPMMSNVADIEDHLQEYVDNWEAYADSATVESVGLNDMDHIMLEFAAINKNQELIWPREAAAKAGRVRRLAEEDMKFRQMLQGLDDQDNVLLKPPNLVGMEVDAMDSMGRWFPVKILEVDIVDEDTDEEPDDEEGPDDKEKATRMTRKVAKVDFEEHGGHAEWIDVESDRLATVGRFTSEAEQQSTDTDTKSNGVSKDASAEARAKAVAAVKRSNSAENGAETTKICPCPGFGACGLTNLGNTCYANSAIQCISFLPLLRAYLLSAQYKATGDLNKDNPLGTGGKLLEEFAELLRIMWSGKLGEKSPTRFRAQLGKINPQFSGADQQDAQEFLNFMLDVLHEDSNKVRKKPYVEHPDDDWVRKTALQRVGEEAWRRFLRRNRSVMTDVAMGQVLNTVTCPVCKFSSRNFDPFNLLSIPIPTVADVIFQCTVFRRATASNCPWILNKSRKGDKRSARFSRRHAATVPGPPSHTYVAEQYIIAMSRLADSSDLRMQIQNICGIPAHYLRLCRTEELIVNKEADGTSVVKKQMKIIPFTDKEGPCSQLARKRSPNDDSTSPTHIMAFETTLKPRTIKKESNGESPEDTADEEEEEQLEDQIMPTEKEQREIERCLEVYGDEKECRLVDSDPLVLAKAVSRSLWPTEEEELKLGLRVDARDHRGNWYPGSVVELIDDEVPNGHDADTGEDFMIKQKRVRVHFDNFSSKWDEIYAIEHFEEGRVRPLYSHASPRAKPTEFLVHHRHTDRTTGHSVLFGQSFFVQCHNDWSSARAGAQILAQAARFLQQTSDRSAPVDIDDDASLSREGKAQRLYDKTHSAMNDLIDLLVDCDREYIRLSLGMSDHNSKAEKASPFRNPSFDVTGLSSALVKKVSALLHRLPFEIRICSVDAAHGDRLGSSGEEVAFAFSLIRTIGNYMNARNVVILQWREPPVDKKSGSQVNYLNAPVMYIPPTLATHKPSLEILRDSAKKKKENEKKNRPGSAGIDLGVCLTEFCKAQELTLSDNWRCPQCKQFREGRQSMNLWRLPDLLTFHIKRFNMSARWREKITTKVNFPLTGLDMSEWCHKKSPVIQMDSDDTHVYDLIGVMNHYGSMTGGHYVATCKATACGRDGREEVAYSFNGANTNVIETEGSDSSTGWRLGRKTETNQNKIAAAMSAKAVSESAEPLWLQFDDELVEPIPPANVVSEMAYVLFYRRRRMTPSNIAKYSTLE